MNEKVANELVKIAKELSANDGKISDAKWETIRVAENIDATIMSLIMLVQSEDIKTDFHARSSVLKRLREMRATINNITTTIKARFN